MDVYYLAIAYLATMRNWENLSAFRVSRFLYFYRLVGVVCFELSQVRALLLIFPNTFEYFFIAYEGVRSRWSTLRFPLRWWVAVAAVIWVVVKLPQEYWIHVAQLDVTDILSENAWAPPLLAGLVLAGAAALLVPGPAATAAAGLGLAFAADPMPVEMDTAAEQSAWHAQWGSIRSWATLEKVVLVGLIAVVYGNILPGVRSTTLQLFLGVAVVIVINAGFTLALARRSWSTPSLALAFLARLVVNVALVWSRTGCWPGGGDLDMGNGVLHVPDQPDHHTARPLPAGAGGSRHRRARAAARQV